MGLAHKSFAPHINFKVIVLNPKVIVYIDLIDLYSTNCQGKRLDVLIVTIVELTNQFVVIYQGLNLDVNGTRL